MLITECEGCDLDWKNCAMRKVLIKLRQYKPDYSPCPCFECLVKIICRKNCDELNMYYQNLIWDEHQVEAELHAKKM